MASLVASAMSECLLMLFLRTTVLPTLRPPMKFVLFNELSNCGVTLVGIVAFDRREGDAIGEECCALNCVLAFEVPIWHSGDWVEVLWVLLSFADGA